MEVNRKELLDLLNAVSIGLDVCEGIEQSNAYVFTDGKLVTFNDEILVRAKSPLDFSAVVPAEDFKKVLSKFPDDDVEVSLKGTEILVKGKKRTAGITGFVEVLLKFSEVPTANKWEELNEKVAGLLQQAARTCGTDISQPLTTLVHAAPNRIEACDNFRLLRADLKKGTGFPVEVLIPARSISALGVRKLTHVSIGEGWVHFKTDDKLRISLRCSHGKYHENIDDLLKLKDCEEVTLPANLAEMVARAEVMQDSGFDAKVNIAVAEDELIITSRKEGGWYKERKRVKYSGTAIRFEIHPKTLVDILGRTRTVLISKNRRMKLEADGIQYVASLTLAEDTK